MICSNQPFMHLILLVLCGIGLSQFAHGGGGLALHGENSKGASVLYHKGSGSLSFYDMEGNVKLKLPEMKK